MSTGKHLLDDPADLVLDSLRGLARSNHSLHLNARHRIIFIPPTNNRVHLLSGGGSGHEPAHAGYVGSNMLDCAVSGDIFASPSAKAVLAGIEALSPHPVILICKNYTGDRLHFGIALEKARASGRDVEMVVVADDISIDGGAKDRVGARGLAGTVLIHKILGGCVADGFELREAVNLIEKVKSNLVTIGMSLSHASVPGGSNEMVQLAQDQVEIGMGIHNEPGVQNAELRRATDLANDLLDRLCRNRKCSFSENDNVVLLVNNLGGISSLELLSFVEVVSRRLEQHFSLIIVRTYAGAFMTSLNGAGVSITLLNISSLDQHCVLKWLDLDTTALGWRASQSWTAQPAEVQPSPKAFEQREARCKIAADDSRARVVRACRALIAAEAEITELDTVTGDGDAGTTLRSAADAVLHAMNNQELDIEDGSGLFASIAEVLEDNMGGTSGALYTIFFTALASAMPASTSLTAQELATALKEALERLQSYTSAQIGDKTLMDALVPFITTFADSLDLQVAVEAARKGMEDTRNMKAALGRASYTPASSTMDAGAVGVYTILKAL